MVECVAVWPLRGRAAIAVTFFDRRESQRMWDSFNSPTATIRTIDWLNQLGFREWPPRSAIVAGSAHWSESIARDLGQVGFDFGNAVLTAQESFTIVGVPLVVLGIDRRNPRVIEDPEGRTQIPGMLDSLQEAAAWLAYALDSAHGGEFRPTIPAPWLAEGRGCRMLLPMEQARERMRLWNEAFLACPQCTCERTWARHVFRRLAQLLDSLPDDSPVTLYFDGEVLVIRCGGRLLPMPGVGVRWPTVFTLPAGQLRHLPRRFTRTTVRLAVFEGELLIDRNHYRGIAESVLPAK